MWRTTFCFIFMGLSLRQADQLAKQLEQAQQEAARKGGELAEKQQVADDLQRKLDALHREKESAAAQVRALPFGKSPSLFPSCV